MSSYADHQPRLNGVARFPLQTTDGSGRISAGEIDPVASPHWRSPGRAGGVPGLQQVVSELVIEVHSGSRVNAANATRFVPSATRHVGEFPSPERLARSR
jgi:hypothetical protein